MANLKPGRRAQLLLVTGFALAVTVVGLAVILNSVIYTENLATRAESTSSGAIVHVQSVEAGTERLIEYVNEYNTSINTSSGAAKENFTQAFESVANRSLGHQLREGAVVSDTLVGTFVGTWVTQSNASREFTNADGNHSWKPVDSGANGARAFRIFVNDSGELNSLNSNPFELTVNDSSDRTWTMKITPDLVNVTTSTGGSLNCSDASGLSDFWVNVSAGAVAGAECSGLDFDNYLDPVQSVEFSNGQNIEGTYRFMVNTSVVSKDFGLDKSVPYTHESVYGAHVAVEVERRSLLYRTTKRVIPGETDD